MDFTTPIDLRDGPYLDVLFDIERARGSVATATGHDINAESLFTLYADLHDIASARIEGNNTTVHDALTRGPVNSDEPLRELDNLRTATQWVIDQARDKPITHSFVREIHRLVVDGLTREGDVSPGTYRNHNVSIANSTVVTSKPASVQADLDGLFDAINTIPPARMQVEQIARCHHRFSVIHPFGNGNGRTGRLLMLAQLMKYGIGSARDLPLTPTAVFGRTRDEYYRALESADTGTAGGIAKWVVFVATGIRDDLRRIVSLHDHDFVMSHIVDPAVANALAAGQVSARTADVVRITADRGVVASGDLSDILTGSPSTRSQKLRPILDAGFLEPVTVNARTYRVPLHRGPLVLHVMTALDRAELLPPILRN